MSIGPRAILSRRASYFRAKLRQRALALALPARGTPWYAWRPPAHGLVAAWCPMDPRPRTPGDQGSCPASVAIKPITTRNWRVEAIAVEAGRNLTLHQGLGPRTGTQRTGSSTLARVEQVRRGSNMLHHVGRGAIVATPIFISPLIARRWSSSALLYNHASFAMLRSVSPAAYPSPNPDLTLACATSRAHDECAHFCSWTGGATQRASI